MININQKIIKITSLIFYLVIPFIVYCLVELLQTGKINPNSVSFWMNLALYYGLFSIVYFITGRTIFTVIFFSTILIILGLINHFVIYFRDAALQPWDFYAAKTAMNVFTAVKIEISPSLIFTLLCWILIIALAIFLSKKFPVNSHRIRLRFIALGIFLLCTLFFIPNFVYNSDRFYSDPWETIRTSQENGLGVNLLLQMKSLWNPPPDGYDSQNILDIAATYANNSAQEATATIEQKPNIIVIMNEAFSDLSIYGDLETNRELTPNLNSLKENSIYGRLIVPVFGGGTCNTEYEFLTGNSCFMLRENSYPMEQFVTRSSPSLAATLKGQGYETVAIHPYYPDGWNRNRAYPLLGFDRFLSLDDFENPEIMRQFVSDRSSYQKIIEQLENQQDKPLFIFNVTMQNHYGYDIQYDNFQEDISFPQEDQFPQLKQYLSLLPHSDQAFSELIDYLEADDKPTIVLFFGDHQPKVEDAFYQTKAEQLDLDEIEFSFMQHTVPYYIWSNFPLKQEHFSDLMSVNYLSSILLDAAGLELTPYQEFLLQMSEIIPVVSSSGVIDNQGDFYPKETGPQKYLELMDQYNKLQYNQVFDKKQRKDEVFFLP